MFLADDGAAWIIDFGFSELAASDGLLATDLAELLASSATQVGAERAVAAGVAAVGPDAIVTALDRLQLPEAERRHPHCHEGRSEPPARTARAHHVVRRRCSTHVAATPCVAYRVVRECPQLPPWRRTMSMYPLIRVLQPQPFDLVDDPVQVAGIATGFEATVNVRVRDGNGNQLVVTFAMAGGGTGERGNFQVTADLPGPPPTAGGFVEVFDAGGGEGPPDNPVVVPVVFGTNLVPTLLRVQCVRRPAG